MTGDVMSPGAAYRPSPGDLLHVWPGVRAAGVEPRQAVALTGPVPFGSTPCVRVRYLSGRRVGGTDYLALTHVEQVAPVALGRNLDSGPCPRECAYGTCNAAGTYQGCGGCCGCLGGCQTDYEGKEVRRQYRVSDRHLVRLLAARRAEGRTS